MIFVAVGTQKFPFNRLLRAVDTLIEEGVITEEVFAQTGNSDYQPKHYSSQSFMSKEDFDKQVEKSDLLITHSGVGTIISGMQRGKGIIVVPRLAAFGEHVDDHQLEIAKAFSQQGYVLLCGKDDSLKDLITEAKRHTFVPYESHREGVVTAVRDFLEAL